MRLFICEKPSLAKAVAKGLGGGKNCEGHIVCGKDIVTWCFGHILEQAMPEEYDENFKSWKMEDLPIIPAEWKMKVSKDCAKQFGIIQKLVRQADEIVNGGDPDREGQLLIDEVLDYIGNIKPVKRILLNALDDVSVRNALNNLRDNKEFIGLKNSALARSRADWLVGMNLTRAYTIRLREAGYTGVVPVGRVQTPTMALVVRREEEIKNFRSVKHFKLQVMWQHSNGSFFSIWQPREETVGLDDEGRLVNREIVDALLEKFQTVGKADVKAKITKVDQTEKKEQPRLPYSLSSLQIEAGKKFGFSPQQVLDSMQSLYEKKLSTYPRSDCEYLPESQLEDVSVIFNNLKSHSDELADIVKGADMSLESRAWNDKKITAHHAIIPTRERADLSGLSDVERELYIMIAKAYVAQFYPTHVYLATKILVAFDGESFSATGKIVKEIGWRKLYVNESDANSDDETQKSLPIMREGDRVAFMDGKVIERDTKPPQRFSPASLLEAMKKIHKYVKDKNLQAILQECHGIGTEATRAGIIENLQKRGFLSLEKKYLVPSEKAYQMCKVLADDIIYPDSTAIWEIGLDDIREKRITLEEFHEKQIGFMETLLNQAKRIRVPEAKGLVKCPKCGKPMIRRKGNNGFFWGCTGYPVCRNSFPDKKGKPDFAAAKLREGEFGRTTNSHK